MSNIWFPPDVMFFCILVGLPALGIVCVTIYKIAELFAK